MFYQTNRSVWICPHKKWEKYMYENNITPIVMTILDCTNEAIQQLLELFEYEKETFIDVVRKEIEDENFYKMYSN